MPKFIDLSGSKFGQLTVLSQAPNGGTKTRWNCVCECGNTSIVAATHLRSGHTISCGCAKKLDYCSLDLTGKRFGRLVAISQIRGGGNKAPTKWVCKCDCGNTHTIATGLLTGGHTKSCGCWQAESRKLANLTHGHSKTATYYSWGSMLQRCTNPKKVKYPLYGGRGIKVCDRWLKFANFLADMGEKPEGKTLDRIDVNGNYEPSNCRWATPIEQSNNTRINKHLTFNGVTQTISQWSRQVGMNRRTLADRLKAGVPPEKAMM